eukprot:scaffold26237_cov162-Skeletonema_dohrnii-CCMP3373.AAC.1
MSINGQWPLLIFVCVRECDLLTKLSTEHDSSTLDNTRYKMGVLGSKKSEPPSQRRGDLFRQGNSASTGGSGSH